MKQPKRKDILKHTIIELDTYWSQIMKKLGLDVDAFEYPIINFCKKTPHTKSEFEDIIYLNWNVSLKSYKNCYEEFQGMQTSYESLCLESIIHETVHYIQNKFYDIYQNEFVCSTEGLATIISLNLLSESGKYEIPATQIADMFHKMNKEYDNYFKLPEKYNQHIDKILQDKNYKPQIAKEYAAGFVFICEYFNPVKGNFLELLINPFSDEECYSYVLT